MDLDDSVKRDQASASLWTGAHGTTPGASVGVWAPAEIKLDLPASRWSGLGTRWGSGEVFLQGWDHRRTWLQKGSLCCQRDHRVWGRPERKISWRVEFICPGVGSWGDWDPGTITVPVECLNPAAGWIYLVCILPLEDLHPAQPQREAGWSHQSYLHECWACLPVSCVWLVACTCVFVVLHMCVYVCAYWEYQPCSLVGPGTVELWQPDLCWAAEFGISLAETANFCSNTWLVILQHNLNYGWIYVSYILCPKLLQWILWNLKKK